MNFSKILFLFLALAVLANTVFATFHLVNNGSFETGTDEGWVYGTLDISRPSLDDTNKVKWDNNPNNLVSIPVDTNITGNYLIRQRNDYNSDNPVYDSVRVFAYFNDDFDLNAHDFNQGSIYFKGKVTADINAGLAAIIACNNKPTNNTQEVCFVAYPRVNFSCEGFYNTSFTSGNIPFCDFNSTINQFHVMLPDSSFWQGKKYFALVFFIAYYSIANPNFILIDDFKYEVGGEITPILNSLTTTPSPVDMGQTITVTALTTGTNQKLQCGLTQANPTGLCVSANWADNPSCSFTNSQVEDYNIFCRAFNSENEYSSTLSSLILVNPTTGTTPTGTAKVLFYVYVNDGTQTMWNYAFGKTKRIEDADFRLFNNGAGEDGGAPYNGFILITKSTGEDYLVETCNYHNNCDVDLNAGYYTARIYDSKFLVEQKVNFYVEPLASDSNYVWEIDLPYNARWFQLQFMNTDWSPISADLIRGDLQNAATEGKFAIENWDAVGNNIFTYGINGLQYYDANHEPVWFDSTNHYGAVQKHKDYAYILPYTDNTGRKINYLLVYYYYHTVGTVEKWASYFIQQFGQASPMLLPNYFNRLWIKPDTGENGITALGGSSPQTFLYKFEKDKAYYKVGDNITCRAYADATNGRITLAEFKLVSPTFAEYSGRSAATEIYSAVQNNVQLDYTFTNFSSAVRGVRCAFKITNDVGFQSAWRFSQPFNVYSDLNGSVKFAVKRADGAANDMNEVYSLNNNISRITLTGAGSTRDINVFMDANYSLEIGAYTVEYKDNLDSNKIRKFAFNLTSPEKTAFLELVVGNTNSAPVVENLQCFLNYDSVFWITGEVYDNDGDLNAMGFKYYDDAHSPDNPSYSKMYMNDTNEGNITKQYLDAILIPSGVLVDTAIHQPAKTCTSNHKCIFGINKSIMDEISAGTLSGTSDNEALTCDINAIDSLGHFVNVRKTHYVDFPDIFVDTNNSFCGFTTCEQLDGTVTGNIYSLSSIQNPIPFSCKIIVFNKATPTSDFKIYFADKIADINYKSTNELYGMDGLNCYSGKVDVSDWGEGLFSNLKTKISHSTFGTFNLYTTSLIIAKVTTTNPAPPSIEGGQAQFEQGLRGVANNMGNFLMFMLFGFFTNPIGFFMTYFIVFIVLIFLWLSFRGR